MLLLQDMVYGYGTADAVNKNEFMTDLQKCLIKAQQLRAVTLFLSFSTVRSANVLNQAY